MFKKDDEKYLIRQLSSNQVVLFLGSGFSLDAKNLNSENFPTGWTLGKKIWEFLEIEGEYDDTSLPEMYQAFLQAGIKKQKKIDFLERNLLSSETPDSYKYLTFPYWFKIYTTNIDDVLTKSYGKAGKRVQELRYPFDQYKERDQALETTQIVYLHGKLPCDPEEVIFSPQQYAKAQLTHEPLYGQFVYDYSTLPTIFIGTELNEPLFERYLVARDARFGLKERRPKSFLITPSLSPVKISNFKSNYNVHHISGKTSDFLDWLKAINENLPPKREILKSTFPNLLNIIEYADIASISKKTISEFAKSFKRVPKETKPIRERSGFLTGTSPRWNDILLDLDVPRTISLDIVKTSEEFLSSMDKENKTKILNVIGYAGSGKSTILKRVGLSLSQRGRTVFFSYSDFIPKKNDVVEVLSAIKERVVLIFDNSKNALSQLPWLIEALNKDLEYTPLIILGIRTNYFDLVEQNINPTIADQRTFKIPNLDDKEIDLIIQKLEEYNLLGRLSGMSNYHRVKEFKNRAHRQILIAMKEATNGMSFNEIIKDEFNSLKPYEAKILALCVALNTELGFTISKQDFVGFSNAPQNEALGYLETVLQGTIISAGSTKNRFMLRHRILADYIIKYCVDPSILKEAYIRVLSVLAPELIESKGPSRIFNLYKALINHVQLYRRFRNEIDLARDVYESITEYFKADYHFWLQYGSLEVEGKDGNLLLAENYIAQAESLAPKSNYVKTAKCNLLYKQAYSTNIESEAIEYKSKADTIAQSLILEIGKDEQIPFYIYCTGRYKYITKWIYNKSDKKKALDELKSTARTGLSFHPFNKKLQLISSAIDRAYLQLGLQNEVEDPDLPGFI